MKPSICFTWLSLQASNQHCSSLASRVFCWAGPLLEVPPFVSVLLILFSSPIYKLLFSASFVSPPLGSESTLLILALKYYYYYFCPWYFIPKGIEIVKVEKNHELGWLCRTSTSILPNELQTALNRCIATERHSKWKNIIIIIITNYIKNLVLFDQLDQKDTCAESN